MGTSSEASAALRVFLKTSAGSPDCGSSGSTVFTYLIGGGDPVPVLERRQRLCAERRRQLDLDHARPRAHGGGEPTLAEDLDHAPVVRAHQRDELRDPGVAGALGDEA